MVIKDIFLTVFESGAVVFALWALFNENKFYTFEKRLFKKIKNLWEVIR